ncbi:MAG: hypothetical protein GOVbin2937_71 [Prokaryotic dsDNA virus sp.]|nr:MAG: hypothetical protein GOVbin2937_71 [Prokaryotic dsDNA virus sp.]|tara:strand:- start:56 stop:244 length:189 start_codon:yes stop_codon:yes gene_type:complete
MTPRWTAQGDGLFTAPGGYAAEQQHSPLSDVYTLILPSGAKHTGTAQECRQIAAQHAQENAA